MKIKLISLLGSLALALGSLSADESGSSIKFSNPDEPGRFSVHLSNGEITIHGGDYDEVTVSSDLSASSNSHVRKDGLRVISSSSTFSLEEHENVVILDYGSDGWTQNSEFHVTLPRDCHIDIEVGFGGEIQVTDIDGDVVIKNLNGEVDLRNLGGGAIVESANGEIAASFNKVSPDRPLSFSSMNGEISLRLPSDAAADVRFRTHNGNILTNFSDAELVTKTTSYRSNSNPHSEEMAEVAADIAREAVQMAQEIAQEVRVAVQEARSNGQRVKTPRAPRAPRIPSIPAMAGGKVIAGTLNGGGASLQVATMNGDIVIRKNKE